MKYDNKTFRSKLSNSRNEYSFAICGRRRPLGRFTLYRFLTLTERKTRLNHILIVNYIN